MALPCAQHALPYGRHRVARPSPAVPAPRHSLSCPSFRRQARPASRVGTRQCGARASSADAGPSGSHGADDSSSAWDLGDMARPAERVWDINNPQTYYFAVANAQSLLDDGALLEEVLSDAISRCNRGGRPRDVWMVMEPAFLDHPKLAPLKNALSKPTAAILSTNGPWMLSIVRELLPQATIGKFSAPTATLPNPFKSNLKPDGAVIGGGAIWH